MIKPIRTCFDKLRTGRTRNARTVLALVGAIGCVAAPQIALAQDFPGGGGDPGGGSGDAPTDTSPPPEKLSVTETGVDIRTGRYAYSKTDLNAGSLSLTRQISNDARGHLQPFSNMAHNWDIFIAERRFDMTKSLPPAAGGEGAGNDFQLFVHYGGSKQTFAARVSSTGSGHESSASGYLTVAGDRASAAALYTFEAMDGTLVEFRAIGSGDCSTVYRCAYVSKITQANGEILTFSYDLGGTSGHGARLSRIESNLGMAIRLEYGGSGGTWHQVTKACIFNLAATSANSSCNANALQTASYTYNGKLASVTDAVGEVWQYAYPGGKTAYYYPGETAPYLTNTSYNRLNDQLEVNEVVTRQERADGLTVSYGYAEPPYQDSGTGSSYPYIPPIAGGVMSDSAGRTMDITFGFPIVPGTWQGTYPAGSPINFGDVNYQTTSGPVSITDPLGRNWTMDYCDPVAMAGYPPSENHRCLVTPVMQSYTDPEGIKTEYKYDGFRTRNVIETRRKAKPSTGLPDIVTSAVHDCINLKICKKPLSVTDAEGNTTDFAYDPVHGGMLKRTAPADDSGVRPETRYTWGQRYAWLKNAGGGYTQAATPVWVQTSQFSCNTSAMLASGNCAAGASDKVVTTYEYQAGNSATGSNVFRVGMAVTADGQTLRTCYGLDEFGRQISETQPKAGLATCQ